MISILVSCSSENVVAVELALHTHALSIGGPNKADARNIFAP
jgi:hypothetical protein